jgi:hypothetical protein
MDEKINSLKTIFFKLDTLRKKELFLGEETKW